MCGTRRPRRWLPLLGAVLGLLLIPGAASAKGHGPSALFWGAQIGEQITGEKAPWDMRAVDSFEQIAGKGPSLISFNSPFAECGETSCAFVNFPTVPLESIRRYGAIPVLNWSTNSSPFKVNDPGFRLSSIISGLYDNHIRYYAAEAKRWGHPLFLRLDWEMNGFWFPWGETVNGNRRGEFVLMWRHIHDIFASMGVTNVTWVWCPNVNIGGELQPLNQVYPGGRYVDWTCLDGFNWGKRGGSPGWLSFDEIFRKTYSQVIRLAPKKPMMIGETASTDRGGDKAAWIKHTLRAIRTKYRKIRALIWLDVHDRGSNWPIEKPRRVKKTFRKGIRNPAYRPNVFANLPPVTIEPPRRGR